MAQQAGFITRLMARLGWKPSNAKTQEAGLATMAPKDVQVKRIGLAPVQPSQGKRGDWEAPTRFVFNDITKAYDKEGYVRQAIDKYVDTMFKAGWKIASKNQKASEYINMRLKLMALATTTPTDQFFIEIAEDLVKYHNVFILKNRQKPGQGPKLPGVNMKGVGGQNPIAGYELIHPSTITIQRDINGSVYKYRQIVTDADEKPIGDPKEFKPEDVIHLTAKKDRGDAFGIPFLLPALDDIRLFRQFEELIFRLVFKFLFPTYTITVGTTDVPAEEGEIEKVQQKIGELTLDGALVLPERYKVDVVGGQQAALDAYDYLKHFEQRIFTDLGVSETLMGRGDTANRGTADSLDAQFQHRVKAYQKVYQTAINEFIMTELLLEGNFDPISKPEDAVTFEFNEIDLEALIKKEIHAIYKYEHNAWGLDEARLAMGLEPITDLGQFYTQLIKIPELQAAAEARASATASNSTAATDNKQQPTNQRGTRTGPKVAKDSLDAEDIQESVRQAFLASIGVDKYEARLNHQWDMTEADTKDLVARYYASGDRDNDIEPKELDVVVNLTIQTASQSFQQFSKLAVQSGLEAAANEIGLPSALSSARPNEIQRLLTKHNEQALDALSEDLKHLLHRSLRRAKKEDAINQVMAAFSTLKYRLGFIARTEMMYAYNYAFASLGASNGKMIAYPVIGGRTDCIECRSKMEKPIYLTSGFFRHIPPFHPECVCSLTFKTPKED